jgi:hypothetical protein
MSNPYRLLSIAMLFGLALSARADEDKPLGTGKMQNGLVIDVLELKPTSETFLKVSFQIRNPGKQTVKYGINAFTFPNGMYYVEAGGKFKYTVIKDDRQEFLWGRVNKDITLRPGDTFPTWAKFGVPHEGIKHLTFYFLDTEPIEDVPVPASLAAKTGAGESKPAASAVKALGTGKMQNGLVIDVLELKPTNDTFLKVSFQIRNLGKDAVKYGINGFKFPNSMYYVEEGGKFKHLVVKDDRGEFLWGRVNKDIILRSGEKFEMWAKFGMPSEGIRHLTFYFQDTEPIEDVSVPTGDK